jgi:SAM-dependent methyltransferase
MMHFDKQNQSVLFGDKRREQRILCDGRTLAIEPDALMDFTALPFADGAFKLVAFDPPHLKHAGEKSWLRAKYGVLGQDWQSDLRKGFAECFRVLADDGVLVFKWAEDQVKLKEVLQLTPQKPIFGHPTGRKGLTHWMVFMKGTKS